MTLFINKKKIDEKSKMEGGLKTIPVFVQEIKGSKMSGDFTSSGTFYPVHEVVVMSEAQGKVVEIDFNTGDFFKQGQTLVRLDDEMIRSNYELAVAAYEKAKKDLMKFESLLKSEATSAQALEDIRLALRKAETDMVTTRKQLENATIKAPIQGTITKKMVENGTLLMPGTPVAEIVDISRLKFITNVSEKQVVNISRGMKLKISSDLFPGVVFNGIVKSVSVKADDAKRFPIEIELSNNTSRSLMAGMYGTASFGFNSEYETLIIPRTAIVGSIRSPRVYVVENNTAILKDIKLGNSTDKAVEVTEGLRAGERVITSGQINLDNNTLVSIVNK